MFKVNHYFYQKNIKYQYQFNIIYKYTAPAILFIYYNTIWKQLLQNHKTHVKRSVF